MSRRPAEPDGATLADEAEALLVYAAEHDLLVGADPDKTAALRSGLVEPLAAAIRGVRNATGPDAIEQRSELLARYSALTSLTGDVTGRSVIDSGQCERHLRKLNRLAIGFAVAALLCVLVQAINPSSAEWAKDLTLVLTSLSPLAWGGLGTCVFLLKTLSDKVANATFDGRLLQGVRTRILLGAVLGFIVTKIFDPSGLGFSLAAIAFLTGLGIKVVYGALENTVEALAAKFNLGSLERAPAGPVQQLPPTLPQAAAAGAGAAAPGPAAAPGHGTAAVLEIQRLLAGLGRDPGPIDGVWDAQVVALIRDFLPGATDDEVDAVDLGLLATWLRDGRAPPDWRSRAGQTGLVWSRGVGIPAGELGAYRDFLRLCGSLKLPLGRVPADLSPSSIADQVRQALSALTGARPELAGQSFSQILDTLRKEAGAS